MNTPSTLLVAAGLLLVLSHGLPGAEDSDVDRERLEGRSFRFSWSSPTGAAVNGIATLKADGTIEGIHSPNETTWRLDSSGRLLFEHADGRVSTRYEKVRREEGLLQLEGPFLFREGITHHLVELEGPLSTRRHEITPAQADRIRYSTQSFVYLDIGEVHAFRLEGGAERRIRLVSVREHEDSVIGLVRSADVELEVDGDSLELTCAPYTLPTVVKGMRLLVDTTSAWLMIPKRVQLSVWDATEPVVDTSLFGFPLPGYRLFSHGMQAYNEPVHLGHRDGDPEGQRFYHNYGVDLAGFEGRQKVLSAIEGVVVQTRRQQGDLCIRDERGFVLHYGHLDSILTGIRVGSRVERGQWVGMLGRRGSSGNFSHLHVGAYRSESALASDASSRALNLYPWLVAAYRAEAGAGPHAVARPHHTVRTGEVVELDGTRSLAFGPPIVSYRWEFQDGTRIEGALAEKVFDEPGCHVAALWIRDESGATDVDFCKVKVFSRSNPEDVVPTLFVTQSPAAESRVGQPIHFRIWPQGDRVDDIRIDFGDGTVVEAYEPYSAIPHAFRAKGIHVVTIAGTAGPLPVTQKVKVVVDE